MTYLENATVFYCYMMEYSGDWKLPIVIFIFRWSTSEYDIILLHYI